MKIKHFKRMICFLLAVVVLLSMPLDTTAHAVAVESWAIYALITFMTAMGLTFTVAGGVDAMVQAIQEKVDEYEVVMVVPNFWETLQNHIKLTPPSGGSNVRDLFFSAHAVEAINEFLQWLTNDGGWSLGSEQSDELTFATWEAFRIVDGTNEYFTCTNTFVDTIETASYSGTTYYRAKIINLGTNLTVKTVSDYQSIDSQGYNLRIYYGSNSYYNNVYLNGNLSSQKRTIMTYVKSAFGYSGTIDQFLGDYKMAFAFRDGVLYNGLVADDGYFYYCNEISRGVSKTVSELSSEIRLPLEIPEFKPLPTEGILLNQDFIGSPDLIEWGNWVESIFTDTGTIPQPNPQIVQDPDYAPEPTPAPTPVPSPEIEDIEDLGLPTLGEALFNKFPFSLPRDLKRIADILNAEPVAPFWEVDLFAPLADDIAFQGDTTLRIDLTEYEVLGQISRWASVIGFCIMLIIITKGVIKW